MNSDPPPPGVLPTRLPDPPAVPDDPPPDTSKEPAPAPALPPPSDLSAA